MGARGPVARAHEAAAACLNPGAWAVDATTGNGHDTRFLAGLVGPEGRVDGVDTQPAALSATRRRLEEAGMAEHVRLHHGGHEGLLQMLPDAARGRVRVVMFNLGYLPGGDKGRITRPETTLAALEAAAELLAPGGRITVVAYPGHPGGDEECRAVTAWVREGGHQGLLVRELDEPTSDSQGPRLMVLERDPAPAG